MTSSSGSNHRKRLPIVGRDSRVDLTKYTLQVHGQDIIDYEKLKADDPALYKEIVAGEFEADRRHQEELDEILTENSSAGTLEQQLQAIKALSGTNSTEELLTEADLQMLCTLAGWQLTWQPDYFAVERTGVDVFYDLLEPQHVGFVMDWRYSPQDLLRRIKGCTREVDAEITESTLIVKKFKPFNDVTIHHYDIELSVHGERFFGSLLPEEPDYFLYTILQLSQVKNVQFTRLLIDEDAYCFIGFSSSADPREIADFLPISPLVSESRFIPIDEPARAKYFYIPVFTTNPKENIADSSKSRVDVMAFGTPSYRSPTGFASRVLPGQTLHDAIRADLQRDFNYLGGFEVLDYYLYDTGTDKQGNELPRLIVHIAVDKFATEALKPVGMGVYWVRKDMSYLYKHYKLGFGLEQAPNL